MATATAIAMEEVEGSAAVVLVEVGRGNISGH